MGEVKSTDWNESRVSIPGGGLFSLLLLLLLLFQGQVV